MKQAFRVLKERPTVTLRLTRDSVAAGDDVDAPHERQVEVHSFVDPVALVNHLHSGYLPTVAGIGHSWSCKLNGHRIATIQGNGVSVQAEVREVRYEDGNHVHFSYSSARW